MDPAAVGVRRTPDERAAGARAFAAEVIALCDPSTRALDRSAIEAARAAFTSRVERASIPVQLMQLEDCCRALRIDPDGASFIAAGVARLEEKWGPAASWVPPLHDPNAKLRDHVFLAIILATAEGRALAAAKLEDAIRATGPKAAHLGDAPRRVIEGLTRESRLSELTLRTMRAILEDETPDAALVVAMIRVEPALALAIRDVVITTLARLPSTSDWLRASRA